jgi:hypothetical protein
MKLFFTLLLLCNIHTANAVGPDKLKHAAISGTLAYIGASAFQETEHPNLYAAGLAILPGLAKYHADLKKHPTDTTDEQGDITADVAGILIGLALHEEVINASLIGTSIWVDIYDNIYMRIRPQSVRIIYSIEFQ